MSLLDVKYFNMFEDELPHKAMHLEGIAPLQIKHLFSQLIANGLFTLDELNDRLLNINFCHSENDKPMPIFSHCLNNDTNKPLRATASQILLLVLILPFLIVHKIPECEEHWSCFLLRKILDIVLSLVVSTDLCSSLKLLIGSIIFCL